MNHLLLSRDMRPLLVSSGQHFQVIDMFGESVGQKTIVLEDHASLIYLPIISSSDLDINIQLCGSHARLFVFALIFASNHIGVKASLHTRLMADATFADVHLLSIVKDGDIISLDGGITLDDHISGVEGYLDEEQLLLGSPVSIKALPMLTVKSYDVKASHSANIQKLDEQKLFYMMAKGLDISHCQKLVLDGYLRHIFAQVDQFDEDTKERILSQLFEQLGLHI